MGSSIEEKFKNGIRLRDEGSLKKALDEFLNIIEEFPNYPKISGIYTIIGGIYSDLNDVTNSFDFFKIATELNPESELASLGLYLSYVKLGQDENAIFELDRYLSNNDAEIYKDTLEELLSELSQGRLLKYKEMIIQLAKKNDMK